MPGLHLSDSTVLDQNEDRRALRESVGRLVSKFGHADFQKAAKAGKFTEGLWKELGAAGFLGVHLPEEYGGGGGGMSDLVIVIEECAAHGSPVQMIIISPAICGSILAHHGSEVLKDRWLAGIADGSKKMAFAITEPDAGTNTHRISSTLTAVDGGGWRLNGGKYWTSGADEADAILVVARDAEVGPSGKPTLSLVVVDARAPGLTMQVIDSALGAPEKQFMLFFNDVPVAADSMIGEKSQGLRQVFAGLNPERLAVAALANGIALYALEKGANYANDRMVWGVPIGSHQGVAHPLAKSYVEVQLARLMNDRAAAMIDAGLDGGEAANMAKYAAGEACLGALDNAIQTHGGNGFSHEYGLADLWFTARLLRTAPVSREMVLNYIAQHSLGLPKSY